MSAFKREVFYWIWSVTVKIQAVIAATVYRYIYIYKMVSKGRKKKKERKGCCTYWWPVSVPCLWTSWCQSLGVGLFGFFLGSFFLLFVFSLSFFSGFFSIQNALSLQHCQSGHLRTCAQHPADLPAAKCQEKSLGTIYHFDIKPDLWVEMCVWIVDISTFVSVSFGESEKGEGQQHTAKNVQWRFVEADWEVLFIQNVRELCNWDAFSAFWTYLRTYLQIRTNYLKIRQKKIKNKSHLTCNKAMQSFKRNKKTLRMSSKCFHKMDIFCSAVQIYRGH